MIIVANVLVALVALLHAYILVLEMFLWTTPRGQRAFGLTAEFARQTRVLGMNQGLYNGFLAAGLVAYGTPLTSFAFKVSMGVILIGYVLQRLESYDGPIVIGVVDEGAALRERGVVVTAVSPTFPPE